MCLQFNPTEELQQRKEASLKKKKIEASAIISQEFFVLLNKKNKTSVTFW